MNSEQIILATLLIDDLPPIDASRIFAAYLVKHDPIDVEAILRTDKSVSTGMSQEIASACLEWMKDFNVARERAIVFDKAVRG